MSGLKEGQTLRCDDCQLEIQVSRGCEDCEVSCCGHPMNNVTAETERRDWQSHEPSCED